MTAAADAPEALLRRFDDALAAGAVEMELCVVGGAVVTLAFAADPPSRRPGSLFVPRDELNDARRKAAERGRVPLDRLDEAARALARRHPDEGPSTFEGRRLRVLPAPPDYVLAMRCAALEFAPEPGVDDDVRYLLRYLGLRDGEEAVAVVDRYLNPRQRPEDLLERLSRLVV